MNFSQKYLKSRRFDTLCSRMLIMWRQRQKSRLLRIKALFSNSFKGRLNCFLGDRLTSYLLPFALSTFSYLYSHPETGPKARYIFGHSTFYNPRVSPLRSIFGTKKVATFEIWTMLRSLRIHVIMKRERVKGANASLTRKDKEKDASS